ncbi:cytochrome P450, putative, partial [Ixodes scapularis]
IPIKECLFSISFNVISAVLFGSTYKDSDQKHRDVKTHIMNFMRVLAVNSLVDFYPVWLRTVMACVPFTEVAKIRKKLAFARKFISARVMEHRDTLEEDTTRDFIDGYLKQMMDQKDNPNSHYRECHLIGCALDFFAAGVAGVPLAIHWLLLICAQNPYKVQSRIHAEIDRVVGRERQPAWKDRLEMPFTMASIWELLRWRKEGLLGFPRGVKEDILLEGFLIPKGTVVLPNTTAMNRNPYYWKRPEEYDPTRFLTPDGTELLEKPEYFIPFSFGKRMCPGESLATVQLFLYATCLMQKYCVQPEE